MNEPSNSEGTAPTCPSLSLSSLTFGRIVVASPLPSAASGEDVRFASSRRFGRDLARFRLRRAIHPRGPWRTADRV